MKSSLHTQTHFFLVHKVVKFKHSIDLKKFAIIILFVQIRLQQVRSSQSLLNIYLTNIQIHTHKNIFCFLVYKNYFFIRRIEEKKISKIVKILIFISHVLHTKKKKIVWHKLNQNKINQNSLVKFRRNQQNATHKQTNNETQNASAHN